MAVEISRLQSPAAVQAALDEFSRLGRTAFLKRYGFGKSRDFLVRNARTGQLCDSKAIVGAAFGHQFPQEGPLKPTDFSGGEATVVPRLQHLGFDVVRIGEDWTFDEVQATVASYFEMLLLEAEQLSKLYSVYCWLCFKFPDIFRQSALAAANRALLSKFIEKTLAQHNKRPKSEVLKKVRGATSIDFDLSLVI